MLKIAQTAYREFICCRATVVRSFSEPPQILLFSKNMSMKNVTDVGVLQRCKDQAGAAAAVTFSLTLHIVMFVAMQLVLTHYVLNGKC